MNVSPITRRTVLGACAALALGASLLSGGTALAQQKMKVAAIYTVPVEQQWVSRIHKALNAAVARGEIEYKFSENVTNAGLRARDAPVRGAGQHVHHRRVVRRSRPRRGKWRRTIRRCRS
jgi:hypothetical protein